MTYTRPKVEPGRGHVRGRDIVGKVFVQPFGGPDYICTKWYDETRNIQSVVELEPKEPGFAFTTTVSRDGTKKISTMRYQIAGTIDDLESWGWTRVPEEVRA